MGTQSNNTPRPASGQNRARRAALSIATLAAVIAMPSHAAGLEVLGEAIVALSEAIVSDVGIAAAVLAVVIAGVMALFGIINFRWLAGVVIGIGLIFGAAALVAALYGGGGGGGGGITITSVPVSFALSHIV